jgi:hypothetical protein
MDISGSDEILAFAGRQHAKLVYSCSAGAFDHIVIVARAQAR